MMMMMMMPLEFGRTGYATEDGTIIENGSRRSSGNRKRWSGKTRSVQSHIVGMGHDENQSHPERLSDDVRASSHRNLISNNSICETTCPFDLFADLIPNLLRRVGQHFSS